MRRRRLNPILDFHQKELAAYLARARGPGQGAFKIMSRPRPAGEAARVVYKEYDLPLNPDLQLPARIRPTTAATGRWARPRAAARCSHDATADADGNLWFTALMGNRTFTVGRMDAKTGAVKPFKVNTPGNMAAGSHGILRDPKGVIWFNVHLSRGEGGKGALGKIDPKTDKLEVFLPPAPMSQIDGPVTLDYDPRWRHSGRHDRWRAALRSGHGTVHRVQITDSQERERRPKRELRHGERSRRQCVVDADFFRPSVEERRQDRANPWNGGFPR